MSNATISAVVEDLRTDGILAPRAPGKDDLLRMAQTTGVAIGIELGFQYTVIAARNVDQRHDQARVEKLAVGAAAGEDSWLEAVVERVLDLVAEVGKSPDDLATLGIGVPRIVNPRKPEFTRPLLPPWDVGGNPVELFEAELRKTLGGRTPPVLMDNDANLGALGEFTLVHPDKETLVYVKASTGIGAGVMIGGKILRGRRGAAGEIGHTRVERAGKFCLYGGRGCLETVIGADALVEQARTGLGHRMVDPPRTIEELISKAEKGSLVCRRVLAEAGQVLGVAIGNVCNLLNPDIVVIGGTLGQISDPRRGGDRDEFFLGPCLAAVRQTALTAAYAEEFAVTASRAEPAVAHGALTMGLLGTVYR